MRTTLLLSLLLASACGAPPATPSSGSPSAPSSTAAPASGAPRATREDAACPAGHAHVVLVRHAEKAASPGGDPDLAPAGVERARRLAVLLGDSRVTRLVATDVKRTQQTLAPLASRTGKAVEIRPARDVEALVTELRGASDGAVVVVAHHSNGIPRIVRGLGAEVPGLPRTEDAFAEDDYRRVIVVTLGCDRAHATAVQLSSDAAPAP